jgi:rhodanese-related sulfurtransferase
LKYLQKIFWVTLQAGLFIILSSCIEDNIIPPLTGDLDPVAEMIYYFESHGDFANSDKSPAIIEAEEVYNNLNNYLIIDIRTQAEFGMGHIENAVNVQTDSLYKFVEEKYNSNYQKIILISKNGESSAYFTCLLRLDNFDNVYTMNFGMASWNEIFADEWLSNIGDFLGISNFSNNPFPKNDFTALPRTSITNPDDPLEKRVTTRIQQIIKEGFKYGLTYYNTLPSLNNKYPICYGKTYLYNARRNGQLAELGHPDDTRSYLDASLYEFRSSQYLQTLPTNTEIFMYDYNGQLSACMAAYLRVLGYDVKILLYGANQLFYSRLISDPELLGYAFTTDKIQNYPYVVGE